jgi:hypothetical protein
MASYEIVKHPAYKFTFSQEELEILYSITAATSTDKAWELAESRGFVVNRDVDVPYKLFEIFQSAHENGQ